LTQRRVLELVMISFPMHMMAIGKYISIVNVILI
jgi:hypothetical protein